MRFIEMMRRGYYGIVAVAKQSPPQAMNPLPNGDKMSWLLAILNLLPIIASGVQALKKDATVGDKTTMATDSLNLALAGAAATAPASEQPIIAAITPVLQSTLASTVQALHTASSSAVVA